MIILRWREVRPVTLRWIGPSAMAPPLRRPDGTAVAAVIGPEGDSGPPGPPGADGDGATDPGDLTLIFNNQLI